MTKVTKYTHGQVVYINLNSLFYEFVLESSQSPTNLIGQYYDKQVFPIEWLYLPNQVFKALKLYTKKIKKVVSVGQLDN